jgi:hypothetical protein
MISGKNGLKKIALETVSATGKKILRGKVIIGKKIFPVSAENEIFYVIVFRNIWFDKNTDCLVI